MTRLTTRQAAKSLGISHDTLAHYVEVGKVPAPEIIELGKGQRVVHAWTEQEIENVRKLLPKIANGRRTRYQKLTEKRGTQPGAAVPHESRPHKQKRTKTKRLRQTD